MTLAQPPNATVETEAEPPGRQQVPPSQPASQSSSLPDLQPPSQNKQQQAETTPSSTCNAHLRHSIYHADYVAVEQTTRPLLIGQHQLELVCRLLEDEFRRGLHRETNPMANVKMYPTHIRDHPARYESLGHFAEPEEGKFLALDLGGTNFRVILVSLEGSNFHMENEAYSLTEELMHGPGGHLFDYIAACLHRFVTARQLNNQRLPLGFTFSFPIQQDKLAHARLVNWTKGFRCSGVEGRDVVELLREAIERRPDLDIEVMAVLNDTTGTLIACAYKNRECRIGLIVGTGTNACYMEDVDEVHCMAASPAAAPYEDIWRHSQSQTTVVNTEWGAFGDNGSLDFIRTTWDHLIDVNSVNEGKQKFEKMISGLYIGELCRRIMVEMALGERRALFRHLARRDELLLEGSRFSRPFSFETKFVSAVESDPLDCFDNTRRALSEAFGFEEPSEQDCASVKLICMRVSTRAAHLVSAAVACLLNKMARPYTVVGVDGSMFKYHPHFHSIMANKTKELTRAECRFQLMFSEDGSGRGAAIVAAVAQKRRRISAELMMRRNQSAETISQLS